MLSPAVANAPRPLRGAAAGSFAFLGLLLITCASCGEPDAGVHVELTVSDPQAADWGGIYFDHITVTASATGKRAIVCLFPTFEATKEIEVAASGPDPCADAHGAPWTLLPNAANWALQARKRSINFVFPRDADVKIEAVARLGGGAAVARGTGTSTASEDWPAVALSLRREPDAPVFPDTGSIQLLDGGVMANPVSCNVMATSPCPAADVATTNGAYSAALFCANDAIRILNSQGATSCAKPDQNALVAFAKSAAASTPTPISAVVKAHFAACKTGDPRDPGGCELTTGCVPPATTVAYVSATTAQPIATIDLSMLPPTIAPIAFGYTWTVPSEPFYIAVTQDAIAASENGSCFFEITNSASFVPL